MARPLDLLIDRKSGDLSTEKLWFNIHNAVLAVMAYRGAPYEVLLAYGSIAHGGGMLAKYLSCRNPRPADQQPPATSEGTTE